MVLFALLRFKSSQHWAFRLFRQEDSYASVNTVSLTDGSRIKLGECLSACLTSVNWVLIIAVRGQPETDLFSRYTLEDHLLAGLILIIKFHPVNQ